MPLATTQTVWLYWEGPKPDWIQRCHQTIFWHCDDVRLLGPEDAEVRPARKLRHFDKLCMPHRADLIRAHLLVTYGGFWIDSDCVAFRPLKPIFDLAAKHGFVAPRQHDGDLSIAFLGCRKGHPIAVAWHERQKQILAGENYGWLSFGSRSIWDAVCREKANWFRLDHWVTQPIWWSDPQRFYYRREDQEHREHLHAGSYTYMLSNMMNQGVSRPHDLLEKKTFFSYLMRESKRNVFADPIPIGGKAMNGADVVAASA